MLSNPMRTNADADGPMQRRTPQDNITMGQMIYLPQNTAHKRLLLSRPYCRSPEDQFEFGSLVTGPSS